jgi:hypothetical protein
LELARLKHKEKKDDPEVVLESPCLGARQQINPESD